MPESDDIAKAFNELTGQADFDPMRMMAGLMAGKARFHSVFLAPFTPTFAESRARYLADGSGPLASIADELGRQGAPDPAAAARQMLAAAQGMCVVVIALDHAVTTVPQLFFGHLPPELRQQMVDACGPEFPEREDLAAGLAQLAERIQRNRWPALVAGPALGEDLGSYWLELAAALLEGLDGGMMGPGRERSADLAWWVSQGVLITRAGGSIDADDLELLARVQLFAGDAAAAGQGIDALIRAGGADEETVIELLGSFVEGAIAAGQAEKAAAWLAGQREAWDALLGGLYDLPLALLRLQAAAGVGSAELVATARLLATVDRKAARNDLTKEPIWQVVGEPGTLLDTAQAAERIGRSTSFVAKRLEGKTIPWCRSAEQVRLPERALDAWKAVMDELKLLD